MPAAYVSRAGEKLAHALEQFRLDVHAVRCADFGSHVGGFVDCLLQRGAARVYAIDTAYGTFDYRLRNDPRVVVMERTNAVHCVLPEPVGLVTIDVGWTRQALIVPAALRMLGDAQGPNRIISLVKPQYEADQHELDRGVVLAQRLPEVLERVRRAVRAAGTVIIDEAESPIPGRGGNKEFLFLLAPAVPGPIGIGDSVQGSP